MNKMKITFLLALLGLCLASAPVAAQVYTLPAEEEPDIKDICLNAVQQQWAIDMSTAEKNLEDIYRSLNFNAYKIETISCGRINNSALAYMDPADKKRYILINESRLTNLNSRYFSHLFIIAHEFAHHAKNHFSGAVVSTNQNKRLLELEADEYAAAIVRKLGGTKADCLYALDLLNHPADDTYSSHPTKDKRITAIDRGFPRIETLKEEKFSLQEDLFSELKSHSFVKYPSGLTKYDISGYAEKYGMIPQSILYYDNSYWVLWRKSSRVKNWRVYWNYDEFPETEIRDLEGKGYNIESVEKLNNKWFVVMQKYPERFGQKWRVVDKSDFKASIQADLEAGYSIQNLVSKDNDTYLVLLTKYGSDGYFSWSMKDRYDEYKAWRTEQEKNTRYNFMYLFKRIDGKYFTFLQHKENNKSWSVNAYDGQDPEDIKKIITKLNGGYQIVNVFGDDKYIRFTLSLWD